MPKRKMTPISPRALPKRNPPAKNELLREIEELRIRLEEAEETIRAIRSGDVDAVIVSGPDGDQVFTLASTETERQFHQLADSIYNLAWMANPDGWIFWYNRRWYEYTGTSPEQMEGWGWQSVHDPKVLPEVMKQWKSAIEKGEPFKMTFPIRGADGVFRPFLSRGIPLKDDDGNVVRWFGTNTDISEQHQIAEALRRSEAEARTRAAEIAATLDAVPALMFIAHDKDCRNMTSNRAVYEMLHVPQGANTSLSAPSEQRPANFRVMKDGKEVPAEELPVQRAAATGKEVRDSEMMLVVDGGAIRHIFGHAVPVLDEAGNSTGAVGAFIDVTERKRAEKALMKSEKLAAAGRLAATIAHEINNPLESVTNLLYLIIHENDATKIHELADVATRELNRVSHIARQTLGFYRESTAPVKVRLKDVLGDILDLYRNHFNQRNVAYETHYDSTGEVHGFTGEMRQVFSNLIHNAIDASPEGGRIRIYVRNGTKENNPGVNVFICDSGAGIKPEHQPRIFEPFFTTKGQKGTGLGLWVAKDLVQKQGGHIRVRSAVSGDRRGTCFCVFIPSEPARQHKSE